MKLSKKLLQAMTVGLAIGAVTVTISCDSLRETTDVTPKKLKCTDACDMKCTSDHEVPEFDCPACGMG
ncbi:MAG: hypothetical protein ACI9XO_002917 [Paraglaciecola sp.]|jgi:hypothetical protein